MRKNSMMDFFKEDIALLIRDARKELVEIMKEKMLFSVEQSMKMAQGIAYRLKEDGKCYYLEIAKVCEKDENYTTEQIYENALSLKHYIYDINVVYEHFYYAHLKMSEELEERYVANFAATKQSLKEEERKEERRKQKVGTEEIINFLNHQGCFRRNVVTGNIEITLRKGKEIDGETFMEITDRVVNTLYCRMNKDGYQVSKTEIDNVLNSDFSESFNPFKDYFHNLPLWNGKDYLQEAADRLLLVDESPKKREYLRKWFKRWMAGIVGGVLDDDYTNEIIFTLIGKQGTYKTTFFRKLLPEKLSRYINHNFSLQNISKDERISLGQNMLCMVEEADSTNNQQNNMLKAMLSERVISERLPYDKYKISIIHRASFCATGNNREFLTDDTGNRRWRVFEVSSIVSPEESPFDYEQMWAQAYKLYNIGLHKAYDPEENDEVNLQNAAYTVSTPEEELLLEMFQPAKTGDTNIKKMTTSDILEELQSGHYSLRLNVSKLGRLLIKNGFVRHKDRNSRFYYVKQNKLEDIKKEKQITEEDEIILQQLQKKNGIDKLENWVNPQNKNKNPEEGEE